MKYNTNALCFVHKTNFYYLVTPLPATKPAWNDEESNESRRSTASAASTLQPPPAHQHLPLTRSTTSAPTTYNKPQVIPGTSSTLTPIDLSSR